MSKQDDRYVDEEECEGKQILKVICNGNTVWFRFTDGAYTGLRASTGYYDSVDLEWVAAKDRNDQLRAGIITEEEYERLAKKEEEAAKKDRESWDRKQYELLKKKFEGDKKS